MCDQCNYRQILSDAGLNPTRHRVRVLEVVGNNTCPLNAREIFDTLRRSHSINRVTVYRILDSLVDNGIIERISGGRASFFGLAPNAHHQRHPHFFCRLCGQVNCLTPQSVPVDVAPLRRVFPGIINSVEVRVDGICKNCLKNNA